MPIDDGFPDYWPGPAPTPLWDYEARIPEAIAKLYEAVEVLKQLDHSQARREHERNLTGGRWSSVEKMLISARNASDEAMNYIRVVDQYPEKPPYIRYIKEE